MLIDFRCRRCRLPLSIDEDQKGNTIHCPTCNCEMVVPRASEADTPRGQIIQGVYAVLCGVEDSRESKPAGCPSEERRWRIEDRGSTASTVVFDPRSSLLDPRCSFLRDSDS